MTEPCDRCGSDAVPGASCEACGLVRGPSDRVTRSDGASPDPRVTVFRRDDWGPLGAAMRDRFDAVPAADVRDLVDRLRALHDVP